MGYKKKCLPKNTGKVKNVAYISTERHPVLTKGFFFSFPDVHYIHELSGNDLKETNISRPITDLLNRQNGNCLSDKRKLGELGEEM